MFTWYKPRIQPDPLFPDVVLWRIQGSRFIKAIPWYQLLAGYSNNIAPDKALKRWKSRPLPLSMISHRWSLSIQIFGPRFGQPASSMATLLYLLTALFSLVPAIPYGHVGWPLTVVGEWKESLRLMVRCIAILASTMAIKKALNGPWGQWSHLCYPVYVAIILDKVMEFPCS